MELGKLIERAEPLRILGIKVSQNGELKAQHDWDDKCRRNVYSASKSYTSCAVGMAVKEGLLSLDEKLTEAFAEDLPEKVSKNLEKATVRDLLTMCLGQKEASLMGGQRPFYKEKDWVKLSLAIPFDIEPGTKFVYNNVGPYLAGILVQRRSGCDLVSYLMPRLFEPMKILRPTWETDPLGRTFGAGGLYLNIDELHKFGQLYLQNGSWEGRELLLADWVSESTRKQVENDKDTYGYGYLFWGGEHGSFRADGKYGQYTILLKDKNAVITAVSESRRTEELQKVIFEEIYPQL